MTTIKDLRVGNVVFATDTQGYPKHRTITAVDNKFCYWDNGDEQGCWGPENYNDQVIIVNKVSVDQESMSQEFNNLDVKELSIQDVGPGMILSTGAEVLSTYTPSECPNHVILMTTVEPMVFTSACKVLVQPDTLTKYDLQECIKGLERILCIPTTVGEYRTKVTGLKAKLLRITKDRSNTQGNG